MRQTKAGLVLSVLLLMTSTLTAGGPDPQSSKPKPGDAAPELELTKLLQAPEGAKTDRNNLKGNVVVLEFWATWCAPCIAAMPHLNELATKFKDRPVRFIAITDENESIVAPFLKRRTMKTWVGLDTNRSTLKAYSVQSFPTTIVIDPSGKIAAITMPKSLTEKSLNEIIDGTPMTVAQERSGLSVTSNQKPTAEDDVKPLFALTIKRITSVDSGWSMNTGIFSGQMTLTTALSLIHGISRTRIIVPSVLRENYYEISGSMTEGNKGDLKSILATAIEASLRLKVRREMREVEVFVLSVPKAIELRLRANSSDMGHWSDDEGVLAASAAPLGALVEGVEGVLKQPVIDETNLKGKYDWDVLFDLTNPASIIDGLRKDVGLELTRAKRQIEILVVEIEE